MRYSIMDYGRKMQLTTAGPSAFLKSEIQAQEDTAASSVASCGFCSSQERKVWPGHACSSVVRRAVLALVDRRAGRRDRPGAHRDRLAHRRIPPAHGPALRIRLRTARDPCHRPHARSRGVFPGASVAAVRARCLHLFRAHAPSAHDRPRGRLRWFGSDANLRSVGLPNITTSCEEPSASSIRGAIGSRPWTRRRAPSTRPSARRARS